MNLPIEIYTIIIECLLVFYFLHKSLAPIYSSIARTFLLYICLFGLILITTMYAPMVARLLLISIYLLTVYCVFLRTPVFKTIYTIIIFFVSSIFADLISGFIVSQIGISVMDLIGISEGRLIYNTTAKIVHLLLLVLISSFMQMQYNQNSLLEAVPLIACNIASTVVLCTQFETFFKTKQLFPFVVSTICMLIINIVVCFYTEMIKKMYQIKERERFMKEQLNQQEKYYKDAISRQKESRALWHDIKKYMLAMETLVSENNYDEAETQLLGLKDKYASLEQTVYTGNNIVDGILNYGAEKAKIANVPIKFDLWLNSTLNIAALDLYIIIGNTIDNAIEACDGFPSDSTPTINCMVKQKNNVLFYEISNPIPDSIVEKPGKIHGYGLENVKECVARNNGFISIKNDDNVFCVSVTLNV